ncbi:hypothetical protein CR513_38516, partial [Mucuna pruriens]
MPLDFGGNTTFDVIDLTPCGEDNAYTERTNTTFEWSITQSRLRKIQQEIQHQLTTLKDPREGQGGPI